MIERVDPPLIAPEREMLRAFLDYHRGTLAVKCAGLSDEHLRRQSMPPSTLSLLGLVRHMAEVECTWFRMAINGEDLPLVWSGSGEDISFRLIMLHVIHEYARHSGHADLLREGIEGIEGIDGTVGV